MRQPLCLAVLGLSLATSSAAAQRIDPSLARPRILPERPLPSGLASPASRPRRVPVLVELRPDAEALVPDPVLAIEMLPDVEVAQAFGHFVLVRVGTAGIGALAGSRLVLRALDARTSRPWVPLDRTRLLLRLDAAWARAIPDGAMREGYTGEGVTIADVDTAVDVFHPAFFRGDAGWVDWIDVDDDGVLMPGIDAIDLDGDGLAADTEIARALRAEPLDVSSGPASGVRRDGFDPGYDWLYLDDNGNGRRDTALDIDVTETTAAYGEPLFTPDDVDRDGRLGPHERLVRLGSSKIARALVDLLGPRVPFRREYVRGTDLRMMRRDFTGGVYGYADTLHGTGVAGILAGDLPLVGRRWVGIAPDAELLSAFYWGDTQSEPVMWALAQGADVVLHEYVTWTREALDGGDALGALIDGSTADDGAVHVCPAGNIGGAQKHARASVAAGETLELPIEVPASVTYWESTLYAPTPLLDEAALREPDGTEHPLDDGAMLALGGGGTLYVERSATSRGRDRLTFVLATGTDAPVASGRHTLVVRAIEAGELDAFLSDASSGFGLGVAFPPELATDAGTVSWPATSDACTSVGAVPAYLEGEGGWARGGPEGTNVIRAYSSRGPRIDGDARVHVVAPDNPWSTLGAGEVFPQYPGFVVAPEGSFQVFGGTSGAGPHVAGVAALVVQTGLEGAAVRERLMATAWDDGLAPLPSSDYGAGRLDALRAVAGDEPSDTGGGPPLVVLEAVPTQIDPGGTVTLTATAVDPEGSPVTLRWDEGYDGTWEGGYGTATSREWSPVASGADGSGWAHVKVRARDVYGRVGEAAVRIRIGALPSVPDAGPPDAGPSDAAATPDAGSAPASGGCGCQVGGARTTIPWAGASALLLASLITLSGRARRRAVVPDAPRSRV